MTRNTDPLLAGAHGVVNGEQSTEDPHIRKPPHSTRGWNGGEHSDGRRGSERPPKAAHNAAGSGGHAGKIENEVNKTLPREA